MPNALYVGVQDEDKIAVFTIGDSGQLTAQSEVPVAGGPGVTAVSPDQRTLYVAARTSPTISSYRIDAGTGGLTLLGATPAGDDPTFLATDRAGRYLLAAHYQAGYAGVYPLGADGAVSGALFSRHDTATGAHCILTDPSNRFAFVPHISRLRDNVLEPPKNLPGPNAILQFRFDPASGSLSPNTPLRVEQDDLVGPRHYIFHPTLTDCVYFSNEQGSGVSLYHMDATAGTLSPVQTMNSLPADFSGRNTCSQIHITPSGRFLYTANRGHNSIAGFAVDPATGQLTSAGHAATEAVPSAFCLDPTGQYLFAAGTVTGRLASYRIDPNSGALTPLTTYAVGNRPAAVMAAKLG